jgi:hypothetical protein
LLDVAAASLLPKKSARAPRKGNEIQHNEFRTHVPADRCLLLWTSPYSLTTHATLDNAGIHRSLQQSIFESLLLTHIPEMRESYGAGLLRFHQFCDWEGFREGTRMPADRFLLAAFVAKAVGSCLGKSVRNWLNGLRFWHIYNNAN